MAEYAFSVIPGQFAKSGGTFKTKTAKVPEFSGNYRGRATIIEVSDDPEVNGVVKIVFQLHNESKQKYTFYRVKEKINFDIIKVGAEYDIEIGNGHIGN